jgi:hypothetical protein
MLGRRGYVNIHENEKMPAASSSIDYMRPFMYVREAKLKVVFLRSLGRPECGKTIKELKAEKLNHLIYVVVNIQAQLHQYLDQISLIPRYGLRFEVFEASFFLFDRLNTVIMQRCRPVPLSFDASQKLLEEKRWKPEHLLQYVPGDFVVRYFGLKHGQIVIVYGETIKYRIYAATSPLPEPVTPTSQPTQSAIQLA